ncbi:hypothetical protein RRG08_020251 [Elysia crispata]|uniref:Uncharacterized protein n=1 Tax=Elysia crispata TaxID=231223 RepID=A0AAE1E919_9GAST|nr:hypothetical protein RRG08_020251 [Elysia crispata]
MYLMKKINNLANFDRVQLFIRSSMCVLLAAETAEHVLQNCQTYDALRQSIWNEAVDMTTKLYGPPHELERTAAFIAKAGIAV